MYKKISSFLLMLLGVAILAVLITYDPLYLSLNSTSIHNNLSTFYSLRNISADILLQIFGVSIYLLPLLIIYWSYKLYLQKTIVLLKYRLVSFLYCLIILPSIFIVMFDNQSYGGILGLYLITEVDFFSQYYYIFLVSIIAVLYFSFGISFSEIKAIVKLFYHTTIFIAEQIKKIIFHIRQSRKVNQPDIKKDKEINILPNLDYFKLSENKIKPTPQHIDALLSDKMDFSAKTPPQATISKLNVEKSYANMDEKYHISSSFLTSKPQSNEVLSSEIKQKAIYLEQIIQEFGLQCKVSNIKSGPVVTLYEVTVPAGVKTSKLISLETDIALRMKAISVRIAVIPGKDVVGVEIPNSKRKTVFLKEIIESKTFKEIEAKLPLSLGYDINGNSVIADLTTMPHLLIAGTTGSGKSVGVNGMILSLLYKLSPDQCKLIMIDPKMLELSVYQDIPHLLTPVVTNPKQAIAALKWVVREMENRYYQMSLIGVRNLIGFNDKITNEKAMLAINEELLNKNIDITFNNMPYIVVVIDEMADLMMVAGKEVEYAVQRLAQMARAAGIHLIMSTQRPSVDVITGTIKANFPTRISFQVSSKIDSRTILGEQGAEQLLGKGDMLYMSGVGRIQRVHGPFVDDQEIANVVDYLKTLSTPTYVDNITSTESEVDLSDSPGDKDELYAEVLDMIRSEDRISTSLIQRRFQIGYNRAARIVEQLEEEGFVSKANSVGKREIIIK